MRCLKALLALTSVLGIELASGLALSAEKSVSPDGKEKYECGDERISHSGCFTHWVRSSEENGNDLSQWYPVWCPQDPPKGGGCWGGGVALWYWNGKGVIGDPILKDFWVRDYAGIDDPTKGQENPYGDAIKLPGPNNCYRAKTFTVCIVPMNEKL